MFARPRILSDLCSTAVGTPEYCHRASITFGLFLIKLPGEIMKRKSQVYYSSATTKLKKKKKNDFHFIFKLLRGNCIHHTRPISVYIWPILLQRVSKKKRACTFHRCIGLTQLPGNHSRNSPGIVIVSIRCLISFFLFFF